MTQLVLVVDDSPQNLLVATRHLEAAGFSVANAASGEQALGYLAEQRPDLIILDVLMPGMGGFETCRRIRATPGLAEIPIMFMTALGDRDATAPALEVGADDLLAKPFARSELLLRAHALIRQHHVAQSRRFAKEQTQARVRECVVRMRELVAVLDEQTTSELRGELDKLEQVV